jgi:YHS domain-containing protein
MRLLKPSLAVVFLILGLAISANAGEAKKGTPSEAPRTIKPQTRCPVLGGEIDSTAYTDIQGQRVYLCCPMCSEKLKADPDKYFKKAAEEGILFENIQTTCPVSGEKLEDKSVYTDYEGRRVVFCCEQCVDTFYKDPATYLKRLDEATDAKSEHMGKMDHTGHDHQGRP